MDDLLQEFLEEAEDSISLLDQSFIALEGSPNDMDIVKDIFRVMHTFKGTSGFLGFSGLEKLTHAAENLMDKVREGKVAIDAKAIDVIFRTIDVIKEKIAYLSDNGSEKESDDSKLIKELNDLAEGKASLEDNITSLHDKKAELDVKKASKTPDLDEEIDFEPIVADFVGEEDRHIVSGEDIANALGDNEGSYDEDAGSTSGVSKTPDLDEEIDFEPIPADFVDEEEVYKPNAEELKAALKGEVSSLPEPKKLSAEQKKKAIEIAENVVDNEQSKAKKPIVQQNIKVNLAVLENLMQLVGELVLNRNQLLQLHKSAGSSLDNNFVTSLQRLNIITTELQEGIMKTRMQPIINLWSKFPRIIRDLGKDLNKKISLVMEGEETEIDRQMLEALRDPLTHMIRNAVDHGIEMPNIRAQNGKKEEGKVTLSAYHEGGHIIIKVSDDGKGLDAQYLRKKIIEKNLATESELEGLTDRQIFQYIFKPGFSTAEQVTSISGRGVGMDVVISNIQKIGGVVEIESKAGKGSTFVIKLPLTLAIIPVLTVQVLSETFAIPQIMVSEIVRINNRSIDSIENKSKIDVEDTDKNTKDENTDSGNSSCKLEMINDTKVLRLRGRILPLISLSELLEMNGVEKYQVNDGTKDNVTKVATSSNDEDNDNEKIIIKTRRTGKNIKFERENFVVICQVGSSGFGILVDKVFHTEEIVVKPKSSMINNLEVYSGCTILGDGSVIMIIDPNGVLQRSNIKSMDNSNEDNDNAKVFDREEINFLVFKTRDKSPKAIPLETVSRLEEIDYSKIESSGNDRMVQYRGQLMKLISIDEGKDLPEDGVHETIVFTDRNRVLGIFVEEIIDIVMAPLSIQAPSSREGILGSMVINGKATEILDISSFISREFDDWLGHSEANLIEGHATVDDRRHVLLVDDSAFFRKFMRPVILAAGYKVSTCENGQEALELLKEHHAEIDAVITDIDMPIMNGVELTMTAKHINELKHIPFIALTSHEEKDFKEDISNIGFEKLITKADRNMVIKEINTLLRDKAMDM